MTEFLNIYPLSVWQWCVILSCALCIGISKTGINGLSLLYVPVLALIFDAKPSTGILLPMLCVADLFAVTYYRRNAEWKYIIKLLPWAIAGFGLALFTDHLISDKHFKVLIGICIFFSLAVILWNEYRGKDNEVPSTWWFAALFGIAGGFSTMIGNAAGPVMSVFLLSVRLPKKSFVGTAAWFFMIINILKLPLQYLVWHNISRETLIFDFALLPVIAIGAWLGILFVKKVSEKNYRIVVYVLTLLSTILLFL